MSDDNNDGINDTPYVINGDNVDRYPLMFPFDIEHNAVVLPPQEPFPTMWVAAVSVAFGVIVALGFWFTSRNASVKQVRLDNNVT